MRHRWLNKHKEAVTKAIDQLWKYSYLTPENYEEITNYTEVLEDMIDSIKSAIESGIYGKNGLKKAEARLTELENELEWFNNNVKIYSNTRISLLEMHFTCDRPFKFIGSGYTNNSFFDFKKLVEQINCYYDIQEPYKPSNKIAYGWNFAMEKGDTHMGYSNKGARKYLFACIRNYLIKNGVTDFKTNHIQQIVGLADCTQEDEH